MTEAVVDTSDVLPVFIVALWPGSLRSSTAFKRILRLLCCDARTLINDLERCVRAQLRTTLLGCVFRSFRRIERLQILGARAPCQPWNGLLPGLASRLTNVVRLDLHQATALSSDSLRAVAAAIPHLAQLMLVNGTGLSAAAAAAATSPARPSRPTACFYQTLPVLPYLTCLTGVAPTTSVQLQCLAALTRLTRLEFGDGAAMLGVDLQPFGQLVHLRSLSLPHRADYPTTYTHDCPWMTCLVHLQELHHCPPAHPTVLRTLQSLVHLTSLHLLLDGFVSDVAWRARAPPPVGTAHRYGYVLPSLHQLTFTTPVLVDWLRRFLSVVSMPGLSRLNATVWLANSSAATCVADLAAVVSSLPPAVRCLTLRAEEDSGGRRRPSGQPPTPRWLEDVTGGLRELGVALAATGSSVEWQLEAGA